MKKGHQKAKYPIDWFKVFCLAMIGLICYMAGMLTMLIIHQHQLSRLMEVIK